ncbi:hypothetical protein GCM10028818_41880 [Spirosoma horti]
MQIRILYFTGALVGLLYSCKPKPFQTNLSGYTIHFPTTLNQLQKQYPTGQLLSDDRFVDSSQTVRTEWWFNTWGNNGNQELRNESHGVVMFLRGKETKFDSVKNSLQQRYRQILKPLVFTKSHGDFSSLKPIYVCHTSEGAFLVLTRPDSYRSEPNSLRISIGYNLTRKQEEAFALLGGPIYNDKL